MEKKTLWFFNCRSWGSYGTNELIKRNIPAGYFDGANF